MMLSKSSMSSLLLSRATIAHISSTSRRFLSKVSSTTTSVSGSDSSSTNVPPNSAAPIVGNIEEPLPVSFEDISRATYRIRDGVYELHRCIFVSVIFFEFALGIRRTHCDKSDFLSELCGVSLYLKKDFMQYTGSFKERY